MASCRRLRVTLSGEFVPDARAARTSVMRRIQADGRFWDFQLGTGRHCPITEVAEKTRRDCVPSKVPNSAASGVRDSRIADTARLSPFKISKRLPCATHSVSKSVTIYDFDRTQATPFTSFTRIRTMDERILKSIADQHFRSVGSRSILRKLERPPKTLFLWRTRRDSNS